MVANCRIMMEEIAERFRHEPYHLLFNNCINKSVKFVRECKKVDIDAKFVFCFGLVPARLPSLNRSFDIPVPHAWAQVNGERIELSHPLGYEGILGIIPAKVRPVLRFTF